MSDNIPEILVAEGPLKGGRYSVPEVGLRLGRSSTCEISIPDPALSRNHCLFEVRDGTLWVTDLASANGTLVNDEQLGADSKALAPGDRVTAGDTVLALVEPGAGLPPETPAAPKIDLGFGRQEDSGGGKAAPMRLVLWAVAVLAVAGAAILIVASSAEPEAEIAPQPVQDAEPSLQGFTFEKVEATADGIYRYALSYTAGGDLAVEIDDVPKENRHVRKTATLSAEARENLAKIFASDELYRLDREYAGVPLKPNTLKSFSLHVLRGSRVFDVTIENSQEPPAFRETRERLETFSKNELGIWAIQFSAEKLVEMSSESRRAADAKWEERDVQHGNLAEALAKYDEAVFYLETVNPKPADYGELVSRRQQAAAELDKRYRDQRFLADRAINLQDWATAQRELRVLCEIVPGAKDPRHAEAAAKLLDVESRMKK
ncbi:MAG: FHA domain-containing protein [Kiritimatiellae bacterium]|nr:FHA domain-containing protein [Kiritimatiellia bacterium]